MNGRIGGIIHNLFGSKKFVIISAVIIVAAAGGVALLNPTIRNLITGKKEPRTSTNQITQQFLDQLPGLREEAKSNPNSAGAQQQLAMAMYATGDLEGAKKAYEKSALLDGNNAIVHNNLGNVYRDLRNFKSAETEYRTAMRLNPQLPMPYANLANIYLNDLNRPNDAQDIYATGIKNIPSYIDFYLAAASAYERMGESTKAIHTYKQALKIQPENTIATAGLKRLAK
jgi:tetratricopeptide (TPR) repeat protein